MECPFCHQEAIWCENKEIYGRNYGKSYMCYYCKPCDAYVGCHQNTTRPLGTLADKELRKLRHQCHEQFDKMWSDNKDRKWAYEWLQSKMKLHKTQAHIAKLDKDQCRQLLELLKN